MRKTKVICTIGPSVSSKEGIKSLIDVGMDVCRLNFSHGSHCDHGKVISYVKELRKDIDKPIAILLDTKGPEVRTQNLKELDLKKGTTTLMHGNSNQEGIPIAPVCVLDDLTVGNIVLFDDGLIKAEIIEKQKDGFLLKFHSSGKLKQTKSVNFPGVKLNLPYITEKDKEDIAFGIEQGVEAIAASFAMSAEHILSIKELLRKQGAGHILVFSKIESLEGINHFDEILEVSDGVMVARGDLAVECSFAQVPPMQKMMINKCNAKGKPVIVATQMLESMGTQLTPTRAEVSDVANSVFDGTSCTMLSGETAVGNHPFHTVSVMCEIIKEAEKEHLSNHYINENTKSVPSKVACSAVQSANDINAGAILAFSKSGKTARRISALRPKSKVIVITPEESTFHQSAFLYGAIAIKEFGDYDHKALDQFMCHMLHQNWVSYGDLIVVTLGIPFGVSYTTNTIRIESIGNVVVRGEKMKEPLEPSSIIGSVVFCFPRGDREVVDYSGNIVIMREFFPVDSKLLRDAKAVILQNAHYDTASEEAIEEFSKQYSIPYIKRAEGAMSLLKEGANIRLESSLGLVFMSDAPTEEEMIARGKDL